MSRLREVPEVTAFGYLVAYHAIGASGNPRADADLPKQQHEQQFTGTRSEPQTLFAVVERGGFSCASPSGRTDMGVLRFASAQPQAILIGFLALTFKLWRGEKLSPAR